MPAGPVGVDQCPDEPAAGSAETAQVDDETSWPFPYDDVDQDVTHLCRRAIVQVTAYRDQCASARHLDGDRLGGHDRGLAVGGAGKLVPQRLERAPQHPRHVHLRHSQLGRDLLLAGVAEEVPAQDVALTLG